MATMPNKRKSSHGQSGYTLIELMVVISVAIILLGMSAPPVMRSIRRQAVALAVEKLLSVHTQAQVLAQGGMQPVDQSHYGMVVVQDPGQRAYAALIYGRPTGSSIRNLIQLNDRGLPVARVDLPIAVDVQVGAGRLANTATRELAWFYQYRTGVPLAMNGITLSRSGVNVGGPSLAFGTAAKPLFGLTIGGSPYILTANAVAPDTATEPGISLRSVNGSYRRAVVIYASGVSHAVEF